MPRERTPEGEEHRQEQERYREELRRRGRPEAPQVDRAVSDAVAATFAALRAGRQVDAGMLKVLERISVRLLVSRGCNRDEARDKVRRRLHRLESEDLLPVAYPSLRSHREVHSG